MLESVDNAECAFNLEKGELEDFKKCADILRAVGKTVEENWALGQCPMNLCLEVRFTKATAMTLSPAFSEDLSDHFVWVNVSAMYPSMAKPEAHEEEIAEYLKKWDAFCREVFKRWKGIDNHVKPHWYAVRTLFPKTRESLSSQASFGTRRTFCLLRFILPMCNKKMCKTKSRDCLPCAWQPAD